ncbi:hypothetical protein GX411_04275 [Candidatus Fermentibacteria bacterium]|nr:hypothetical protein [Candidatus Fermentibacteria bacterium]
MSPDGFLLGVTGWPLARTLSPAVHLAMLRSAGLSGSFHILPVRPGLLGGSLSELFLAGFDGISVTVPHKTTVPPFCRHISPEASAAGAVNTLVRTPDGWTGHNTDPGGFLAAVDSIGAEPPFAIIGCGGAAAAVALALSSRGLEHLAFCRDPSRCRLAQAAPLESACEWIAGSSCSTIVNATPLGWEDGDGFPVREEALAGRLFLDLNYNPGWRWRNALAGLPCRVVTGERMLVEQAALAFSLWTGLRPDTSAAFRAIERSRGR